MRRGERRRRVEEGGGGGGGGKGKRGKRNCTVVANGLACVLA